MARIWSPKEFAEAERIYHRVLRLLRPETRRFLEATRAKFSGDRDEGEARGAWFELRMLGRLLDDDLCQLELERPVAAGATGCTVDLFFHGEDIGAELKAAQHHLVPPVQVSADCSEQYLEEEFGAALRHSRNFIEDQAEMLFREVNRKCGEKKLFMVGFPTWVIVDTNATDWLEHFRVELTREEHFCQLGEAFRSLATAHGTEDAPNHLLASEMVNVGFVNGFRDHAQEHLVVFPRSDSERALAPRIAALFSLALNGA